MQVLSYIAVISGLTPFIWLKKSNVRYFDICLFQHPFWGKKKKNCRRKATRSRESPGDQMEIYLCARIRFYIKSFRIYISDWERWTGMLGLLFLVNFRPRDIPQSQKFVIKNVICREIETLLLSPLSLTPRRCTIITLATTHYRYFAAVLPLCHRYSLPLLLLWLQLLLTTIIITAITILAKLLLCSYTIITVC